MKSITLTESQIAIIKNAIETEFEMIGDCIVEWGDPDDQGNRVASINYDSVAELQSIVDAMRPLDVRRSFAMSDSIMNTIVEIGQFPTKRTTA